MNSAIVSVGSNIEPEKNVHLAEKQLKNLGIFSKKSAFIYTKPLLYKNQADFYNGVFVLRCTENYKELTKLLKLIEKKLKRIRTENKNGPRTIDLDIVLFNNQILDKDVFYRNFIKKPILELFPYLQNTLNSKNYQKYFNEIKVLIDVIIETSAKKPNAVLGLGNWFFNTNIKTHVIDILIVTNIKYKQYKDEILDKIKNKNLDKIGNNPIKLTLYHTTEFEKTNKPTDKKLILFGNIVK